MTAQTRLNRLYPALSIPERLDALLRLYRERGNGIAGDPLLRAPESQADRWHAMLELLNATHTHLGWYASYVEAQVTQVELRYGWFLLMQLCALQTEAGMLALVLVPDADERRQRFREQKEDFEAQAQQLGMFVAADIAGRWLDVRLAEEAALALSEHCFGRDIVHPDARENIEQGKARLLAVQEGLSHWFEVELPEPEDALVESLVSLLVNGVGR